MTLALFCTADEMMLKLLNWAWRSALLLSRGDRHLFWGREGIPNIMQSRKPLKNLPLKTKGIFWLFWFCQKHLNFVLIPFLCVIVTRNLFLCPQNNQRILAHLQAAS